MTILRVRGRRAVDHRRADGRDPTDIDQADVYKQDVKAGTLTRERDDMVFRYDPGYADSGLPPVAATLPLATAEVRERGGAVPAFFAGHIASAPSVPGVQDKISDQMLSLPVRAREGSALLKLSPGACPKLIENEAFFLGLASTAGLQVPRFAVIHDRGGQSGLVVERFDRDRDHRRAQEDAVQLARRWPASKYRLTTRDVFDAVLRVTPARPVAASRLVKLFVFSYLIGNGDLHGKNVSVYDHPEGLWSVTPAYDLLSTIPYGDQRMALRMEGRDANLRRDTFVAAGARVGLREKVIDTVVDDLCDRIEPHVDAVSSIGFDDRRTRQLIDVMRERIAGLRMR